MEDLIRMNKEQAIKKYSKQYPIIKDYQDADPYFIVNGKNPFVPGTEDDKDLVPIRIDLPKPPDWSKIDNFGLEPKDQYFRIQKIPDSLKKVERAVKEKLQRRNLENRNERVTGQKILLEIYQYLSERKQKFRDELNWIKKMWYYRRNGYWFFNNGKPTYIDGWQFFYCNFWHIDIGLPDYRDKDRRFMLFCRWAYTTTKDMYGKEYNFRPIS